VTEPDLEKIVELDASPEQVWEAIATGPGISAWFVPHTVEPGVGGAITASFGGGFDGGGRVTAWEPGRRYGYVQEDPGSGATGHAIEFLIEGRDGGGTVLRFVESGFGDADGWQDEYDALDKGWDLFFGNLQTYLREFAGLPVHNVVAVVFAPADRAAAWSALHRALGLTGRPPVGERVALTGPQPITGVVDVATAEFLGVRSASALHRFGAEGDDGCGVSAYHYFYDEPVDTETLTKAWDAWLAGLFEGRE
jgi:uncharacterized protein YndB with AHSA1/START domain